MAQFERGKNAISSLDVEFFAGSRAVSEINVIRTTIFDLVFIEFSKSLCFFFLRMILNRSHDRHGYSGRKKHYIRVLNVPNVSSCHDCVDAVVQYNQNKFAI